jgi:hypothetical protein
MYYSAFRRRSRAQKRWGSANGPAAGKLTAAQQAEARRRRAQGATLVELARSYGVGKSTISRLGYIGALSMRNHSPGAA